MQTILKKCESIVTNMASEGRASLAIVLALALLLPVQAEARNLYRYINEQGVTVIDFRVPAEFAKKGYEVLNEQGEVIDVIPRELSEDERSDSDSTRAMEAQAKADRERLQKWDESLLRRYSTTEDIEAARDRSLRDLKIRVSILKSNRRSLRQRVENSQARVAEAERSGRKPSEADLSAIADLKDEISSTERAIEERQVEIEKVNAEYQLDIERFELLEEVVQLRRTLEAPSR